MRSQINLGRIFGVRIGLHFSWLLIAGLIVFSLAGEYRSSHGDWSTALIAGLAVLTACLFFASLLIHEMAHCVMAKSSGLPVREITLFALGGVSQIEREASSAMVEFWIAFVGPLTSALLGAVSLGFAKLLGSGPFGVMGSWLGYVNLGLAGFNLLPGFPLDGGRVPRALVWWRTGDLDRATRAAAQAGQFVAVLFIMAGLSEYLAGGGFNGLWITFVGWFLLQTAGDAAGGRNPGQRENPTRRPRTT